MEEKYLLGIDLGGTKTSVTLGNTKGHPQKNELFQTGEEPSLWFEKTFRSVEKIITESQLSINQISGIGIGAPGPMDIKTGVLLSSPNMKKWKNVPLRETFEKQFSLPVFVENDANVAAIGEAYFGNGREYKDFIYITISTGIGAGIILNKKIYRGKTGDAGEIGHIPLLKNGPRCGCGKNGCFEALASGTALSQKINNLISGNPEGDFAQFFKNSENISVTATLKELLLINQKEALLLWEENLEYLSMGIATVIMLFNPEAIIIGGGIANFENYLINGLKEKLKQDAWERPLNNCDILSANLNLKSSDSGLYALVLSSL